MNEFLVFWIVSGLAAWICGSLVDHVFYKRKPESLYMIIGGPLLWILTFRALGYGIYYAIKKKKSDRKYN